MKKIGDKPQCYICKRMFTMKRSVIAHIRAVHLEIRPYKCTLCSHRAFSKRNLEIHINSHRKKESSRKVKFFKYIKAKNILIDFKNLNLIKANLDETENKIGESILNSPQESVKNEINSNELKCQFCARMFSCNISLRAHIRGFHLRLKCSWCDHRCSNKAELNEHVAVHEKQTLNESLDKTNSSFVSNKVIIILH